MDAKRKLLSTALPPWKRGLHTLEDNFQEQLDNAVEDRLCEIFAELYADKKTGEIKANAFSKWQKLEEYFRKDAYQKLLNYEAHCTKLRKKNGMQPFNWRNETPDRVKQALRSKNKLPHFKNPFAYLQYAEEEKWTGFPYIKPRKEYSGENHPLQKNQVTRTAQKPGRSKRAQRALDHYNKTGRLIVPTRNLEKERKEHMRWKQDMPTCNKPIAQITGTEGALHDVAKKLRNTLEAIHRGIWTPPGTKKNTKKGSN
jgi:hypothetical protein